MSSEIKSVTVLQSPYHNQRRFNLTLVVTLTIKHKLLVFPNKLMSSMLPY